MMNGIPTVVVDLSYIVNEENGKRTAERIIDFLYGVSLPLKLYVTRVNETTFIFSVEHLKPTEDLISEIDSILCSIKNDREKVENIYKIVKAIIST